MKIKAYPLYAHAVALQPAQLIGNGDRRQTHTATDRPWLDVPSLGWHLLCPRAFTAIWHGGARAEDIEICWEADRAPASSSDCAFVQSNLGAGRLTFYPGYQFKTEGAYDLWVRGPLNTPKDGLSPLATTVATTLLPCALTIEWQFTRPHQAVHFAAGEPFAALLLAPSASLATTYLEVGKRANDSEAYARSFQQLADASALRDLFRRLSATSLANTQHPDEIQATTPPPASFVDTRDGRIDLQPFAPDFFFPQRFWGAHLLSMLEQYGEVQPPDLYIIDALKLVYLSIPKAACTAIKLALAKANGIDFGQAQNTEFIHLHPKWHLAKGQLTEAQSGYYRFSFVRNPFERLVSCYRQKIIFTPTATIQQPFYQKYFFALPPNSSFADFVQRISQIPDALADNHFKSQYALLYRNDELQVDYVGKVEQLAHDWQPLVDRYHLAAQLETVNVSKNRPGCHRDYRLYYTEALVQLVYARYHKDVEAFGYQAEYAQLLAFAREQPDRLPAACVGAIPEKEKVNDHQA